MEIKRVSDEEIKKGYKLLEKIDINQFFSDKSTESRKQRHGAGDDLWFDSIWFDSPWFGAME